MSKSKAKSKGKEEKESDEELPSKCTDWSLNRDGESKKLFWWNKTYTISIWQANIKVPEPFERAHDDLVWNCHIKYQASAVYKLCCVCNGPEQNDDMKICCYCTGTVCVKCSNTATPNQIAWKPANKGFEKLLRVCFTCDDVTVDAKQQPEIIAEPTNARRGVLRALTIAQEYPVDVRQQLKNILQQCEDRNGNPIALSPAQDAALLEETQCTLQRYFQPRSSASMLKKANIASKAGGIGVIATQDIPIFTVLGVYPGYEDALSGEHAKKNRPSPKYSLVDLNCADYFNHVFDELQLTFTPFINEPCPEEFSNTAWIQETFRPEGRLGVMTVRDIKAGEEILIGYGPLYPRVYPHNYDAYAYHLVEGYNDPPCFALWHWTSLEEKDSSFVCYCGYDAKEDLYTYWETEDEAKEKASTSPSREGSQ